MRTVSANDVLVTGAGCLLPGCSTVEDFWRRLVSGHSGISPYRDSRISSTMLSCFGSIDPAQSAAAQEVVPFKLRRYSTLCSQWGVKAAVDALSAARLDIKDVPDGRRGIFTAQGDYSYPSLPSFAAGIAAAREKGRLDIPALTQECMQFRGVDSFFAIKSLANNLLAIASLSLEMRGDCGAYVQDDSAVIAALRSAVFSLQHGYCDVALLICAGSYNEAMTLAEMRQAGWLSACAEGHASLRPFDVRCDGTIPGEGAIALVLETRAHADRRRAQALAKVSGIGSLVDMQAQQDDAYARCVAQALQQPAPAIDDIHAIVATGRGGREGDRKEARMLSSLLRHGPMPPITCTTSITGSVPACPVRLLAAIAMLRHGQVPPIAHLEQPVDAALPLVRGSAVRASLRNVLTLTSGHTGSHSAVILSSPLG